MNIKVSESDLCLLDYHTQTYIEFGNEQGEDTDLLGIINPNPYMDGCLHNRDHFLFCKSGEIDFLFTTPRTIVNALVTGSSDLPYKLLVQGKLQGMKSLNKLSNLGIQPFQHYRMAKCLLGCANRDLKQSKGHKDYDKKMYWANYYTVLVHDMLNTYNINFFEEVINNEWLNTSKMYLRYLRDRIKELPKNVPDWCVDSLHEICIMDFFVDDNLKRVSRYYFDNWKDSL